MKRTTLFSLTTALALCAPATAQGLMPYLPKETVMAVSAPDLEMSIDEFRQMPLARMWAEEEVQTFVEDVLSMAKEQFEQGLGMAREMHKAGQLPIDPDTLLKLRIQGGTIAVTSLGLGSTGGQPDPRIGVLLHLDFGESGKTWSQLLQMGLGLLQAQAGGAVEMAQSEIGGVPVMTLKPVLPQRGDEPAPEFSMSLNVAMLPDGVLIGTLHDEVAATLQAMADKTPRLTNSDEFVATARKLDTTGAEAMVYMAPSAGVDFALDVLRMLQQQQPQLAMVDIDGVERALQAMGMRDPGTMGMTSSFVEGKCITKAVHRTRATGTKAADPAVDMSFLKWVPKDAVQFSASTFHAAAIYDTLLKGLQAYDAKMAEFALAHLAQVEEQLGFSVRNDLFGALGNHCISWSMPMGTFAAAPEMAFLIKVENEEALVGSLKKLAALSQGIVSLEEGERRGVKTYQISVDTSMIEGPPANLLTVMQPTFAFKNGYLVGGLSASDIKRVFRRMDREDDPTGDIRSNKEFAAASASLPKQVSSISFTDWKTNFESMYNMAASMLAFFPMPEEVPLDMSLLPDSQTLTQHLYGSIAYTTSTADGTEAVSVSPFGPEVMLLIAGLVGAGAAVFAVNVDRGF